MNERQREQHRREISAQQKAKRAWAVEHPSEAAAVKKFRTAERIARIAKVQAQAAARAERKKLKRVERLKRRAEKLRKFLERKAKATGDPGRIIMPSGPQIVTPGLAPASPGDVIRRDCYGYDWGGNLERGYPSYPREAGARCNIRNFFFDPENNCKGCGQYRPSKEVTHEHE